MHHYAYLIYTPAIHFFKPLHITIHRWSKVFHKPWPTTKKNVLLSTSCQSYSLLMNVNRFSNSVCPMQMEVLDYLVPYHPSKEFWNYSRINRQSVETLNSLLKCSRNSFCRSPAWYSQRHVYVYPYSHCWVTLWPLLVIRKWNWADLHNSVTFSFGEREKMTPKYRGPSCSEAD